MNMLFIYVNALLCMLSTVLYVDTHMVHIDALLTLLWLA